MDKAIVISEVQIMSVMEQMCAESLDPETFDKWSDVAEVLRITRKALGDKTAEMQGHQGDKMPNLQGQSISELGDLEVANLKAAQAGWSVTMDEPAPTLPVWMPKHDVPISGKLYYLIEHGAKWWDGTLHKGGAIDCRFFTSDPNLAKRFDNKVEPQLLIEQFGNSCQTVTEHLWVDKP